MKTLRFLGKIVGCLAVCAVLARADSLQLRSGRHLQGKYVGGTATAIGFMTSGAIEYFPTSDVLVLIFDSASDSLGGLQPSPMKGHSRSGIARLRQISASTGSRTGPPNPRTTTVVSNSEVHRDVKLSEKKIAEREAERSQPRPSLP